jgi:hypothetical protein
VWRSYKGVIRAEFETLPLACGAWGLTCMASSTWDCNCGNSNSNSTLRCTRCGKSLKLDENLTGYSLPEPPIDTWVQELKTEHRPSAESLAEVKQEYAERKKAIRKNSKEKKQKKNFKFILKKNQSIYLIFFGIVIIVTLVMNFLGLSPTKKFDVLFNETKNQFKFMQISDNKVPMYFAGCGPISYAVRQNYASERDLELIQYALAQVSETFGRDFIYKGLTDEFNVSDTDYEILINFTSIAESQDLSEASVKSGFEPAGLGGGFEPIQTNKPVFGSWAWKKGMVWVEKEGWFNSNEYNKVNLIMHEIGHVIGLGHPDKMDGQIMGYGDSESMELGTGDKLGILALSALAGCREMPTF